MKSTYAESCEITSTIITTPGRISPWRGTRRSHEQSSRQRQARSSRFRKSAGCIIVTNEPHNVGDPVSSGMMLIKSMGELSARAEINVHCCRATCCRPEFESSIRRRDSAPHHQRMGSSFPRWNFRYGQALVASDLRFAVEDSDSGGSGRQREPVSDDRVWNGVIVEIESGVDGLAWRKGFDQIGLEGMCGERNQSGFLFFKDLAHEARIIRGPAPRECDAIAPFEGLAIETLDAGELTSGEEGVANVADGAFDASLLVAASGIAGPRGEMIMAAKLQ